MHETIGSCVVKISTETNRKFYIKENPVNALNRRQWSVSWLVSLTCHVCFFYEEGKMKSKGLKSDENHGWQDTLGSWFSGQKQVRRSAYKGQRRDGGALAKEWDALNSGLLKQLFDRYYTLACGWCHYLLVVRCRKKRFTRGIRCTLLNVRNPASGSEKICILFSRHAITIKSFNIS